MIEYFVPRSVSEFDLSMGGDLFPPSIPQHDLIELQNQLPLAVRAQYVRKLPPKPRSEKTVTFEDELDKTRPNIDMGVPMPDVFM